MFAAIVNEGEHVRLPSGRTGVVIGRGEDRRVQVLLDAGDGLDDTVELYAKHVQRISTELNFLTDHDIPEDND